MADCTCNMFDTQIVISACNMSIQDLRSVRNERSERQLDEFRTYRKYGIIGPVLTRSSEEIQEHLTHISIWDQVGYRFSLSWAKEEERQTNDLLIYAESLSSDQVALTLSEFSLISKFYKPLKGING